MKKFFCTIILFFCVIWSANAGSCLIKNEPSNWLKEYLRNLKTILGNISSQAKGDEWWLNSIYSYGVKALSDTFNMNNFFNEVDYFSFYWKFQEIPKEVDRDYNTLKKEDEFIKKAIESVSNSNAKDSKTKSVCAWVKWRCEFKDWATVWDVLRNVSQNHEKVKSAFVKISTWQKDYSRDIRNYILIDNSFFADIETNYASENNISCSEEEGRLWDRVKKKTEEIFEDEKYAKDWIKKWKEAWAMVNGINTLPREEAEAIEKELLRKELSRQWVSWDNQENVLEALEKYNKKWSFSLTNNFVANTFSTATEKFKDTFQQLKEEVVTDFFENYKQKMTKAQKSLPVKDVNKVQSNSTQIKDVKSRIDQMYAEVSNYWSVSEYNSDNLRNRFINTHIEMSNAINKLIWTCKKAVKICNQQDAWNWDCWDCNW